MFLWAAFVICTALIVYAGSKLSKFGDIIAEKTGLGRTWIGVVLMASVTSLPELITGVSSVTFAGAPDIAAGDVLGSCVFNMLILAMLDAGQRPAPISSKAHHGHILSAGFGILLLSIAASGIFLGREFLSVGWIGLYSLISITVYFMAMRLVYFYEKRQIARAIKEAAVELKYQHVATREALIHYGINACIVIIAAIFLPEIGKGIAISSGLGQTFVGNILIALSTSLPEVVISVAAVRMGAIDLAIGNLFGSNIFNVFILALDDLFFVQGPLLSYVNPNHIISAMSAVCMTAIAVVGLTYRAEKKRLLLAWDSVGIVIVYIANLALLFALRH